MTAVGREAAVLFAMDALRGASDWQEAQHALADHDVHHAWILGEAGGDGLAAVTIAQAIIGEAEDRLDESPAH